MHKYYILSYSSGLVGIFAARSDQFWTAKMSSLLAQTLHLQNYANGNVENRATMIPTHPGKCYHDAKSQSVADSSQVIRIRCEKLTRLYWTFGSVHSHYATRSGIRKSERIQKEF